MLSLGPFLQNLIQQPTWGKSWKLPFPSGQSWGEDTETGFWLNTKDTVFPLPPIPILTTTDERWDGKIPKNTPRPRINPPSSSPPPSFNLQSIQPQTGKTPSIWPQKNKNKEEKKVFGLQGAWVTLWEKQQWEVSWSFGPFAAGVNGNTVLGWWDGQLTCWPGPHRLPLLSCHTST